MKTNVPYGRDGQETVVISDDLDIRFLEANDVEITPFEAQMDQALNNPINSPNLKDFLADARDVLVIVNDATRPTPTRQVLDQIIDRLKGVQVKYIIATGAHRGPSQEEFIQIFGPHYERIKDDVIVHDAKKSEEMVFLGKSSNGTEMYVHRAGVEAHKIIIIGSVEPHYFAGYTGEIGRATVGRTRSRWSPYPDKISATIKSFMARVSPLKVPPTIATTPS